MKQSAKWQSGDLCSIYHSAVWCWGGKLPDIQTFLLPAILDWSPLIAAVSGVGGVCGCNVFIFQDAGLHHHQDWSQWFHVTLMTVLWCQERAPGLGLCGRTRYVNTSHYTMIDCNVCNCPIIWTIHCHNIAPHPTPIRRNLYQSQPSATGIWFQLYWGKYSWGGRRDEIWNICYQLKIVHIKQIRSFALSLPVN